MTHEFRESLGRLSSSAFRGLTKMLEEEEQRFYDAQAGLTDMTVEAAFEDVPPPTVLRGHFDTIEGLKAIVKCVEVRWRLDALMALDDALNDQE